MPGGEDRPTSAAREALEVLGTPDHPLGSGELAAFLLGRLIEETGPALDPHPLGAHLGEPWAILGHLVENDLVADPAARALFLLGVATSRRSEPAAAILAHLGDDDWQMSVGERALRPSLAVDAGTFLGRSAAALSLHARRVTTIDWGAERAAHVAALDRVDFRCGRSADVLDDVLAVHPECPLVILDADHTSDGIVAEVEAVLRHPNHGVRGIVIHDTAMPSCRSGLEKVDWRDHPSVQGWSIDFLPGSEGAGGIGLMWVASDRPQ